MAADGLDEFRRAAEALRGADKTVMSEVGKGMRRVAKPVVDKIRAEVRSSKGESPKGVHASQVERQLHVLSKLKAKGAGSIYDPATGQRSERRVRSIQRRLERASSLREQLATASGSSVSAGDKKVELAFRVRASQLPPSQRKLPRRWDSETGWKHPVFGNRKIWVSQRGHPYFRSTVYRSKDELKGAVLGAMDVAGRKITHPDEGTA